MFQPLSWRRDRSIGLSALIFGVAVFAFARLALPAPDAFRDGIGSSPGASSPGTSSAAVAALTRSAWIWEHTERADGSTIVPSDPGKFVVSFQPDGQVRLKAGCNSGVGPYSVTASGLTIEPMPMTLAPCPLASQETVFHQEILESATFAVEGNQLVLHLKLDGWHMAFKAQEPTG